MPFRPWWAQIPVRRNADTHMRELERRAIETGDLNDAVRLYWEKIRVEGEREQQDFPSYRIELPKIGPILLTPRGDTISIRTPRHSDRGHNVEEPVTVNRVDYSVNGAYRFIPPYGWIPYDRSLVQKEEAYAREHERPERLERFTDPGYRYQNLIHMSRMHWRTVNEMEPSAAAFKKFRIAMDRALNAWVQDHPREMSLGSAISANNRMVELHRDAAKLRDKLMELEAELGQAMLEELKNR